MASKNDPLVRFDIEPSDVRDKDRAARETLRQIRRIVKRRSSSVFMHG